MQGLEDYVAARTGSPVEVWNIFDNPRLDVSGFDPAWIAANHPLLTLAVGLAIKEQLVTQQKARTAGYAAAA